MFHICEVRLKYGYSLSLDYNLKWDMGSPYCSCLRNKGIKIHIEKWFKKLSNAFYDDDKPTRNPGSLPL